MGKSQLGPEALHLHDFPSEETIRIAH
jgi:hypothetical protein